jgi:hypothetical protein
MQNLDERMESYLKEFKVREIRPLEQEPQLSSVWPRRLAAAAVIVLTGGLSLWFSRREETTVPHAASAMQSPLNPESRPKTMSPFLLTKLATEDSKAFDAALTEASRRVLPSLRGSESTLRVLAAE